jgi:hypothetical protein
VCGGACAVPNSRLNDDVYAQEVARLLVEGGRLVICHLDWLPIKGNVAWRTEQLVSQHNPSTITTLTLTITSLAPSLVFLARDG